MSDPTPASPSPPTHTHTLSRSSAQHSGVLLGSLVFLLPGIRGLLLSTLVFSLALGFVLARHSRSSAEHSGL